MSTRTLAAGIAAATLACGAEMPPAGSSEASGAGRPASGIYQVSGTTVDTRSGGSRPIDGRLTLVVKNDTYTSHFELATTDPRTGVSAASAQGSGEGRVDGAFLRGTAEVQLVVATAPGVDVGFAFVPRQVSHQIASSSVAQFFADGTVQIEIENTPADDSGYAPTKTVLTGSLVETGDSG